MNQKSLLLRSLKKWPNLRVGANAGPASKLSD
jgi:hypothetical protein